MKKPRPAGRGGMNFLLILSSLFLMMMTSTTTAAKPTHCYVCHSDIDGDACRGFMKGDTFKVKCADFRDKVWGSDDGDMSSLSEVCARRMAGKLSGSNSTNTSTPAGGGANNTSKPIEEGGQYGWFTKDLDKDCKHLKEVWENLAKKHNTNPNATTAANTSNPDAGIVQKYMPSAWKNGVMREHDSCKIVQSQPPKDLWVNGKEKARPLKSVLIRTCGWIEEHMDAKKKKATITETGCIWRENKHPGGSNNRMCTCTGEACNVEAGKEGLVPPGILLILVLLASNFLWTFGF